MRAIVWSISLLAALAAACDKSSEISGDEPQGAIAIAQLKSLCTGKNVSLTREIVVRGVVTGNDHFGEFPHTLIIEDASGGISVAVDRAALNSLFPYGCEATVYCNGLTLGEYGGRIVLGAGPDGRYGVTRIAAGDVARHIRTNGTNTDPAYTLLTFDALAPGHIDRLVRFDGVRFAQPGPWCEPDPETSRPATTEHTIADARGNTLVVRMSGNCSYAKEPVPSGTGSVYGIIDCFNGKYSLRITQHMLFFPTAATLPTACLSAAEYSAPTPTR